jgi:hypothetical protein
MNEKPSSSEELKTWLELTQDQEIDCDKFNELIGPWLDQRIADAKLLQLMAHHRKLCAECNEEVSLLEDALRNED